jgi:arsenical resistance protein ArsH
VPTIITTHLRCRSFSKLMAFEAARILDRIGCEVRIFDPMGLPVKDDVQHDHPKVQELRNLSIWSEAQFWCSPEQHGNITAVMKNQIDWIPLSTGSVRPTQGRILGFAQVRGSRWIDAVSDTSSIRSMAAVSHSTRSTHCAFSDGGCACLSFPIK